MTMSNHEPHVIPAPGTGVEDTLDWSAGPSPDPISEIATEVANHPVIRALGVEGMGNFHGFVQEVALKHWPSAPRADEADELAALRDDEDAAWAAWRETKPKPGVISERVAFHHGWIAGLRRPASQAPDALAEALAELHEITAAITGLIPLGGSECFAGRRSDGSFKPNLKFITNRLRERDQQVHERFCEEFRKRRTAEAALADLKARNGEAMAVADAVLDRAVGASEAVWQWWPKLTAANVDECRREAMRAALNVAALAQAETAKGGGGHAR